MKASNARVYQFGEFELKVGARVLARQGEKLPLGAKAFEILTCLVDHAGEVVTKEQLLRTVWPESFVEESNLSQHVLTLRKALGDRSSYIVTVPGRGYQFTEAVQVVGIAPPLEAPEYSAGIQTQVRAHGSSAVLVQTIRERTRVVIEDSAPSPAALPAPASRHVWPWVVATTAVAALAGGLAWKRVHPSLPPHSQKLVVADFLNGTGDVTFDRTLQRALTIDLAQSPYLDVMSEREAVSTLKFMARPTDLPLTPDLAREMCERTNRNAVLIGSIASVGSVYLLTLEATSCATGKKLASAKAQARSKEDVFSALDSIAGKVRTGLGESAQSVESYRVPIIQATTPSLEALRSYSIGFSMNAQSKPEVETLPFFQRAVELDPNFAMAYGEIATDYYNLSEFELAAQYYRKAFELSDHVDLREKLDIQAHYYSFTLGDLWQGVKTYQQWVTVYPNDFVPWVNLTNDLTELGQTDRAIAAGRRAVQVGPIRSIAYSNLARALKDANRFDEAKAVGAEAVRIGRDSYGLHCTLLDIAVIEHDRAATSREIEWGENHPEAGWYVIYSHGLALAADGHYRDANQLLSQARATADRDGLGESADEVLIDQVELQWLMGLHDEAKRTLTRLHKPDADSYKLAQVHVLMGDLPFAQRYVTRHAGDASAATLMTHVWLPMLRAGIALDQGKPKDAIAALPQDGLYDGADRNMFLERGNAYLAAGDGKNAAVQYKNMLAMIGRDGLTPKIALAHLGLARAYRLSGDEDPSRREYAIFLALFAAADPDLPVLTLAKTESAHLK